MNSNSLDFQNHCLFMSLMSTGAKECHEQPWGSADHGRSCHADDPWADADRSAGEKRLNSSGHFLDFADCKTIDHCNFGNNGVKGRLLGKFIQLYFRSNEWPDCWQGFDICCTIENSGDLLKIGGIYWNSCFSSWDKIVWNWNEIGNLLHFNNAKTSLLSLKLTEKHCKFCRAKL